MNKVPRPDPRARPVRGSTARLTRALAAGARSPKPISCTFRGALKRVRGVCDAVCECGISPLGRGALEGAAGTVNRPRLAV